MTTQSLPGVKNHRPMHWRGDRAADENLEEQSFEDFNGPQIRGFGFDNSGASGTVAKFLDAPVFQLTATERADAEQLVLAFDSNLPR